MEYEQRDLFTHLPRGRGAACTEVRQQTFPDEMTDSIGLQLFFNCAYIVAHLISLFYGLIGRVYGPIGRKFRIKNIKFIAFPLNSEATKQSH